MPSQPTTPERSARRRRPRRRGGGPLRRGTASVEFAFCASIVFFMFLGMIEVARFHVVRHSLDQAVYMGARRGIVPGATASEVDQIVSDRISMAGITGATVTITPGTIDSTTESVTVRAAASYEDNSWALPKYFGGVSIVSEITLDHENVAFDRNSE